jgi:hypothetical protein
MTVEIVEALNRFLLRPDFTFILAGYGGQVAR